MNVGNVHYAYKQRGANNLNFTHLATANISQSNPLYINTDNFLGNDVTYTPEHIKHFERFDPYVQCILVAVGVHNITQRIPANTDSNGTPIGEIKNAVTGFSLACHEPFCSQIDGFCDLCQLFPDPAQAVVSCTGYDTNPTTQTVDDVIGLADEVVNIQGRTFLYLFVDGYQRLAQSLLEGTYDTSDNFFTSGVAPFFQKKLVAIGVGPGTFEEAVERAKELAAKNVARYTCEYEKVCTPDQTEPYDGPTGPIRMKFDDNSFTSSHIAYLTPLPFDMTEVDGMQPYCESLAKVTIPNLAFKANIVWTNFSLSKALGLTPCVKINITAMAAGGGVCDRIIIDGPHDGPTPQLVRQAWLWDDHQILLYTVGAEGSPAANNIKEESLGVNGLVKKIVDQLQAVMPPGITIPQPSWFRSKTWPAGSLMINWNVAGEKSNLYSDIFRRPFGEDVDVFYGNSEMAKDGLLHGWAEGALAMANASLPEIKEALHALGAH